MKSFPQKVLVYVWVFLMCSISNVFGSEQYNYANTWQSWTVYDRYVYLWGFQEGSNTAYLAAADNWLPPGTLFQKPEAKEVKKVRESTFLFFDLKTIRDVVTDLYNDPANSYIPFEKIIYVARDKLRGEDITEALRKARKDAHESHLLIEKVKD